MLNLKASRIIKYGSGLCTGMQLVWICRTSTKFGFHEHHLSVIMDMITYAFGALFFFVVAVITAAGLCT